MAEDIITSTHIAPLQTPFYPGDLKLLSQEALIILYQLIDSAEVSPTLGEKALDIIEQKRYLLSAIEEALNKVHSISIQVSERPVNTGPVNTGLEKTS